MEKKLVSKQQLAKHFGVTEMTVDRWRKRGMPWTRAGIKLVRFNLDEVNAWIDENIKADQEG